MHNTSFFKKILIISTIVLFCSCDKEFNAIGDDIIGDNHFDLEANTYNVTAYNQKVTPVASNNLAVNPLGIYDNPAFGTTTASFNTQVALSSYGPTIGEGAVIDSVTLRIPYFIDATKTVIDADGDSTYVLDSIYGPESGQIKLSVYESGIFLNAYSNSYEANKFYNTDRDSDFMTQAEILGPRLNDSEYTKENDNFFFSSKEIIEITPKTETAAEVKTRFKPEMRLHLNKAFFQTKILDAATSKLSADDIFKNYFKGLYFKVEKGGNSSTRMAMIDFKQGTINIFYKAKTASTTDAETEMESKTLTINLTGNTVSLQEESNSTSSYTAATANDVTPDEKLYLKGGQGSMAVVELFDKTDLIHYDDEGNQVTGSNGVSDELDEIRNNVTYKKWLTNEANLVFHIDTQTMTGAPEPNRIYLYDLTNNRVLTDYSADGTSNSIYPKKSKAIFSGLINLDEDDRGTNYKIRITNHIRNLIKDADVSNVKLGLVVTEDISTITSNKLDKTKVNVGSVISEIPAASVMNPLGTVLFGSNIPETDTNYAKRLKLEIYYTKPN